MGVDKNIFHTQSAYSFRLCSVYQKNIARRCVSIYSGDYYFGHKISHFHSFQIKDAHAHTFSMYRIIMEVPAGHSSDDECWQLTKKRIKSCTEYTIIEYCVTNFRVDFKSSCRGLFDSNPISTFQYDWIRAARDSKSLSIFGMFRSRNSIWKPISSTQCSFIIISHLWHSHTHPNPCYTHSDRVSMLDFINKGVL